MNSKAKPPRTHDRAARLQQEALNCLAIAVHEPHEDQSAALIDEAIRLVRRARELNGGSGKAD